MGETVVKNSLFVSRSYSPDRRHECFVAVYKRLDSAIEKARSRFLSFLPLPFHTDSVDSFYSVP